jgi:hypothetical protein
MGHRPVLHCALRQLRQHPLNITPTLSHRVTSDPKWLVPYCASGVKFGAVQHGDLVYEWGRADALLANGERIGSQCLTVFVATAG